MNNLFQSLVDQVGVITLRPDLSVQAAQAIKAATLKAHYSDFFKYDMYEVGIQFDDEGYKQSFDSLQLIPRWRQIEYVRLYVDGVATNLLDVIEPDNLLDVLNDERINIAYQAGTTVHISSDVSFQHVLIGVYLRPQLDEDDYGSWIAHQHPYIIIHEAARQVLSSTGRLEEANAQHRLYLEALSALSPNALEAKAR